MGFIFLGIIVLLIVVSGIRLKFSINTQKRNVFGIVSVFGFIHLKFRAFTADNYIYYQINSGNIKLFKLDTTKSATKRIYPEFPKITITKLNISTTISKEDSAFASNMSCFAFDTTIKTILQSLSGKVMIRKFEMITLPYYEADAFKVNVQVVLKTAILKIFIFFLHTILLNLRVKLFGVKNGKSN